MGRVGGTRQSLVGSSVVSRVDQSSPIAFGDLALVLALAWRCSWLLWEMPHNSRRWGRSRASCGDSSPTSGAEVAVAFRTLDGRSQVLIDPDKPFHAASTMKVPVMIELFRQVRAGALSLSDTARHPQRVPQHRRRQYLCTQRGRRLGLARLRGARENADARAAQRGDDHRQQQLCHQSAHREARRRQDSCDGR